jgi:hypothetical protein
MLGGLYAVIPFSHEGFHDSTGAMQHVSSHDHAHKPKHTLITVRDLMEQQQCYLTYASKYKEP